MSSGNSRRRRIRQGDDDAYAFLEKVWARYLVAPVIVIMGMYIVGVLIDGFMGTTGIFSKVLAGSGGVAIIGGYFHQFWRKRFND